MDNNEYISKQKVEKWTTKEKFKDFQLLGIEPGTEYNLTGAIEEGELDSALQTKINGKLTAPTTPTADSAVTMLADGTVGTKPLSEIGGGKLYMHRVTFGFVDDKFTKLNIDIPSNTTDSITVDFLRNYIQGICDVSYNGSLGKGVVMLYCLPNSVVISGTAVDNGITEIININHSNADGLTIDSQTLIEL